MIDIKHISKIISTVFLAVIMLACSLFVPAFDYVEVESKIESSDCYITSASDFFQCTAVNIIEQTYKPVAKTLLQTKCVYGLNVFSEVVCHISNYENHKIQASDSCFEPFTARHKTYYIFTLRKLII